MEKTEKKATNEMGKVKVNPLKNERIFVRFVPKENGLPKNHVLGGGKADGAFDEFCVPVLRSTGAYKNILTNDEKDYLEQALGLDSNALSVYNKDNNYWDNYSVRLTKEGIHLNLADPEDYIRYKVLLANSDFIAPSVHERLDRPKATYRYEIVRESEENNVVAIKVDSTVSSYREFGKIERDIDTMRVLVEILDARPYAQNTQPEVLKNRIIELIKKDPKTFLMAITDPMLHTKVIIRRAQELGKITKRGDYYYLAADNSPLCDGNENPTLSIAAKYLNLPAHQDIKFVLESEVNKNSAN